MKEDKIRKEFSLFGKVCELEIFLKGLGFSAIISNYTNEDKMTINLHLIWPNIYFSIPSLKSKSTDYGFSYYHEGHLLFFYYGKKENITSVRFFNYPIIVRHDFLLTDNKTVLHSMSYLLNTIQRFYVKDYIKSIGEEQALRLKVIEKHPFKYTLKDGTVQEAIATCFIEEREWRWMIFKYLPITRNISRTINITFDKEIGEGVNTWKGGVYAASWKIEPNQTIAQALDDMAKNRRFD